MLFDTSEFGSSSTTGRPLFNEVGTKRLDGIIVSTWIFITRSTSPESSPTLLSARFKTIRKRSRGSPIVSSVSSAFDRCFTPTTSSPVTRQIASDRSKHASAEVGVVRRGVDDDVGEVAPQDAEVLPDRLAAGWLHGRVGNRPESEQVIPEPLRVGHHRVPIGALAEGDEVHDLLGGLRPEVAEDVTHVDIEVDDRGVLARDLGDRRAEVRRQERLARAALAREDRDDHPALLRLRGHLPAELTEVIRPDDRALDGVAELLAPLREIDDVADAGAHRGGQQPVPRFVADHHDGRHRRRDRRTRRDRARRAPSRRATAPGRRSARRPPQGLLGRRDRLHPADLVRLDLEGSSHCRAEALRRPDGVDRLRHGYFAVSGRRICATVSGSSSVPVSFGGRSERYTVPCSSAKTNFCASSGLSERITCSEALESWFC